MRIRILSLVLFSFIIISAGNKSKELFEGEKLLTHCFQDIPLTYSKKNDKIVAIKAKELHGQELVLLQYNKKTKEVSYERYFLESEVDKDDGSIYNYLVSAEKYEDFLRGEKTYVFLKFKPKYDRFYLSKCFDSTMKKHPKIIAKWISK